MALRIENLLKKGGLYQKVEGSSSEEVFKNFVKVASLPSSLTADAIVEALEFREKIMSTAVGNGISLPHTRVPLIKTEEDQRISIVYLKEPLDMNAPDERKVYVMFIIFAANQQSHLEILSKLVGLFQNIQFRKLLEKNANLDELLEFISAQ